MLRWYILGLLAIMAYPAGAAKRVTVAQLEQALSVMAGAQKADIAIAVQIGTLEPAERISKATLERLTKLYVHGPQASVALQLLADRSSFLDLPASELPPSPAPDEATQQKQLQMAREFAVETLPRLPNLLATRTTYGFNNSPRQVKKGGWPEMAGLHLVDITKSEVNVLNEQENIASGKLPGSHPPNGLMSWGEFGSALLMVLTDSAKGTTAWSHWEQFPQGVAAVFKYSVPKPASHYEIEVPAEKITYMDGSARWFGATVKTTGGHVLGDDGSSKRMIHERPAYHGSLWIDPASGTILRITLVAQIKDNVNLDRTATLVDYGPVQIEEKSLVCPIRSLALTEAPSTVSTTYNGTTTEWLNESLFTNYHLFAVTSRIVGQGAPEAGQTAAAEQANAKLGAVAGLPLETPAVSSAAPIQTSVTTSEANIPSILSAGQPEAGAAPQATPASPPEQTANAASAPQPSSVGAAIEPARQPAVGSSLVAVPPPPPVAPERPDPDTSVTLHVDVNAVLIPVVVRDEHGQSVDDLMEQNFTVLDDGKPRPLSGFVVEKRAVPLKTGQSVVTPEVAPQTMAASPTALGPHTAALPIRSTVYVFDDLHLTADQIPYAQKAAIETLNDALTGSDLAAIVSTSGKINSGVTRDRAALANAINAVRPLLFYRPDANDCPALTYYQADLIANQHDPTAITNAIQQDLVACNPALAQTSHLDLDMSGSATPSLQPMSDSNSSALGAAKLNVESVARMALQRAKQDLLATYATIGDIAKRMANLPGQHSMILVSPGFPPIQAEQREEESRLINLAAQYGVTIDALNPSGLSTTSLQASEDAKKVRNPVLDSQYREREMHGEENAIWDLADGTGGKFFHNNNDLAAGFKELMETPETVYLLEISLDGVKANGAWHRLTVKTDRAGTQIQARKGYLAPSQGRK